MLTRPTTAGHTSEVTYLLAAPESLDADGADTAIDGAARVLGRSEPRGHRDRRARPGRARRPGLHGRSHVLPLRGARAPLPEHGRSTAWSAFAGCPTGTRLLRPSRAPLRAPATASSTCSSSTMSGGASATPSLSARVRRPCLAGAEPQSSRCLRVACHQLGLERDRRHQPDTAAHLGDELVRTELGQPSVEARLELARPEDEVVRREQVEVRERRGTARRVPRIGRAVRKREAGRLPERLGDAGRRDDAAERQVPARDALGEHDQIGFQPEPLDAEPRAEATESADHAVGNRQHPVTAADLRDRLEVAGRAVAGRRPSRSPARRRRRRRSRPPAARSRPRARLARPTRPARSRARVARTRPCRAARGCSCRSRACRGSPPVAADQMPPLRLAPDDVDEPRQLRRRLDRVAAPARQEHLRARLRRQPRKPIGQLERRAVRDVAEEVEALERPQLGRDRVRDLRPAVADVRVPEARRAVEIPPPLLVPDEDALAPGEHELRAVDRAMSANGCQSDVNAATCRMGRHRSRRESSSRGGVTRAAAVLEPVVEPEPWAGDVDGGDDRAGRRLGPGRRRRRAPARTRSRTIA